MENSITNRQIFFVLLMTLTSFTVVELPKVMAACAGTGGWVTLLIATIPFALAAYVLVSLNMMFQGRTLFDYSQDLVGKIGSYFIAIYFAQYFLTVLTGLTMSMSSLLQSNFLPNTPAWATTVAAMPVLGFVAYKGVTNVARLAEIYGVIFLLIIIISHAVMFAQGDVESILPLFNVAETGRYLSALKETIYPFLGIEVLSVIPFTQKNGPKAVRTAIFTVIFIGIFYIMIVESSLMMVDVDEIVHYNFPLIAAIRQVELPAIKIFQRIDILYLTVGFIGLFSGMSVVYLNIVEYLCRMLPKVKRLLIVIFVGLVIIVAEQFLQGVNGIKDTLTGIVTFTGLIVLFAIPTILLVIAKVKKHVKKNA